MITLEGKVALVTGAAGGIGADIAELFAECGAKVVLTDVQEERGAKTAEAIENSGGEATFLSHDVTEEADWEASVSEAINRYGGLDVLVNNAGVEETVLLAEMDSAAMRRITDVNVNGALLGHKHAARAMRPDGSAGAS